MASRLRADSCCSTHAWEAPTRGAEGWPGGTSEQMSRAAQPHTSSSTQEKGGQPEDVLLPRAAGDGRDKLICDGRAAGGGGRLRRRRIHAGTSRDGRRRRRPRRAATKMAGGGGGGGRIRNGQGLLLPSREQIDDGRRKRRPRRRGRAPHDGADGSAAMGGGQRTAAPDP